MPTSPGSMVIGGEDFLTRIEKKSMTGGKCIAARSPFSHAGGEKEVKSPLQLEKGEGQKEEKAPERGKGRRSLLGKEKGKRCYKYIPGGERPKEKKRKDRTFHFSFRLLAGAST